jgi:hypothetical protein
MVAVDQPKPWQGRATFILNGKPQGSVEIDYVV